MFARPLKNPEQYPVQTVRSQGSGNRTDVCRCGSKYLDQKGRLITKGYKKRMR